MHRIPTIPKGQRAGSGPAGADRYELGGSQGGVFISISTLFKKERERAENEEVFTFECWKMVG